MGFPLAPVLANNTFKGFHKTNWLNEYNLIKPKSYLRYVDDILAMNKIHKFFWYFHIIGILTLNLQ